MKKVMKFVKGKKEEEPMKVVNTVEPPKKSTSFDKSEENNEDDFLTTDKSITKVHKAVWQENIDKLQTIIKTNDIDITDRLDRTALYFAVMKNNPAIVELLLANDANQNISDIDGVTPFLKSIELGGVDCVMTLINHGADFKRVDKDLNTCLHYAINAGQTEILKMLLNHRMDCNVHNINGEYPIHTAVKANNIEMVELLLKHGAGVNAADCKGMTALMFAAAAGYVHIVNLLERYNADREMKDGQGKSAVDYATSNSHKDVVVKLRNASIRAMHCSVKPDKTDDSDTWNDSPLSARSDIQTDKHLAKISEHFFQEETDVSEEKSESDVSVKRSENASPQSGVIPPPCKPLRSLEYLQAGMSSENRPVHLLTLGTVRTRHISMTESEHSKSNTPHRYSYQGDLPQGGSGDSFHSKPPDLLSCIGDEMGDGGNVSVKTKHRNKSDGVHSDWGSESNESLPSDECCAGKKDIKIVPSKDGVDGRDNSFLQKQFSILENYEKNHSRNCSVSHDKKARSRNGSDRDMDDVADFLEDNNRINCQFERYATQSDMWVMTKKSRSLPRNCQPGSLHHTGSMSLPRTLDSGKDFIRDMKRYGSYRPKSNSAYSSKSKNESITSKIQDANNTWLKDSKLHLNQTDYDSISRKSCSSKHSGVSNVSERNSHSERIRSNAGSVHSYTVKDSERNSDLKGYDRKIAPMMSMNFDAGHSRKSSSSRSFSEKINVDKDTLKYPACKFNGTAKVYCEECFSYFSMKLKEMRHELYEKNEFIKLVKSQMEELKDRNIRYSTEISKTTYKHTLAQQDLLLLKNIAKKYEAEARSRRECMCNSSTTTSDVTADQWKKQYEVPSIVSHIRSTESQDLKDENRKLEQHITELQKELHQSTQRMIEMEDTLATVKKEMGDITYETQKEKEVLEEEFEEMVVKMNKEKELLEKELNGIRTGYEKLQGIYSETNTAFNESINQHGNIMNENEKLKDENKHLLHKLCELEKQAASIKGSALIRNKVMWDQLKKCNINFVSSNRSSLEMVNIYYEETRPVDSGGSSDITCICFSNSNSKLDSNNKKGPTLHDIMLEIELLNTEYSEMHLKLQEEELQKTMALLENENDRLKDQLESQNIKMMEMEATIDELSRENCEGCTRMEEILDEHEQLKNSFEEMLAKIEKLQKDLKSKMITIKEQETNIARYIHEVQRLEQNVRELDEKLKLSQSESDKKAIKITALETTHGELRAKLFKIEEDHYKTDVENKALKGRIDSLRMENEAMSEKLLESEEHITKLDDNFLDCELMIKNLETTNEKLLSSINDLKSASIDKAMEYEEKIEEFKKKIEELDLENNILKNTVEEQKCKCDSLLAKIESLTLLHKNEMAARNAKNEELRKENEILTKCVNEIKCSCPPESALKDLECKLKEKENVYQNMKVENNELIRSIKENQNIAKTLESKLIEKDQQYQRVKKETEELKKKLDEIKQNQEETDSLVRENCEMKRAVDVMRMILDEDYEKSFQEPVDMSKITSELYIRLSSKVSPELQQTIVNKFNETMKSSKPSSRQSNISRIPKRKSTIKKVTFTSLYCPKCQSFDNVDSCFNCLCVNNSEISLRTNSLPNLDRITKNVKLLFSENESNSQLLRKSSSVDNFEKLNEDNKRYENYKKCNERWEQQMEIINKLRMELTEVTEKLNDEKNKRKDDVLKVETLRDEHYKDIITNLQQQVHDLQWKSTEETVRNFTLESELAKLKGNMTVMSEMEAEIMRLRSEVEKERSARIEEIEQSKVKKEQELQEFQQKLKAEFIQIKGKLLADLTVAQKTLQAKNIEEKDLKMKCEKLSKEVTMNQEARQRKMKEISKKSSLQSPVSSMFSYPAIEPLPVTCICAIPPSTVPTQSIKDVMRSELDTSIKRHRLQSGNYEEQL